MDTLPMRPLGQSGHRQLRPAPASYYYDTGDGGTVIFVCGEDRAERRRSILAMLALGRQKTALRRLRGIR